MLFVFRDAFIDFWLNSNMVTMDVATQVFIILKQKNQDFLTKVCLIHQNIGLW